MDVATDHAGSETGPAKPREQARVFFFLEALRASVGILAGLLIVPLSLLSHANGLAGVRS